MAEPTKTAAPEVATADPGAKADPERKILIVLAKPDVKEIADLHDKTVVLAGVAAPSDERLKAAFAAAGAGGAQFKQGAVNDVDEVGSGAVAAAIVAVVKPEIASAFPEVPGYRLLRVEVAP
jgi:predicted dienelactone hydrolase